MNLSRASLMKLLHYSAWSTALFIPEYVIFLLLVEYTPLHYVMAAAGTFILGITLQYLLVRRFVFHDALRHWRSAYALFFVSSCAGAGLVALLMVVLVETVGIPHYIARVLAGASAGFLVYLFNLYATFKAPAHASAT